MEPGIGWGATKEGLGGAGGDPGEFGRSRELGGGDPGGWGRADASFWSVGDSSTGKVVCVIPNLKENCQDVNF